MKKDQRTEAERLIDELLRWTTERELFTAQELQTELLDRRLELSR